MRAVNRDGVQVDAMGRPRLNDEQLRRARALVFRRLRREGYLVKDIARLYRLTERRVYQELAILPASVKEWADG